MRFMIVDDDKAVRCMLQDIIEDYNLGEVVDLLDTAIDIDNDCLLLKKIDILIIDMLMPVRDGMQTVKAIKQNFDGKIIMLSQVEDKEMVGNAYSLGVDYYITKPINRNEVIGVIKAVSEHTCLKNFVNNIKNDLHMVLPPEQKNSKVLDNNSFAIIEHGNAILRDLGIDGESGSQDMLMILRWLGKNINNKIDDFPPLKTIFTQLVSEKGSKEISKETKAIEQRLRRTIFQALMNIASMGIVDCSNPKFDDYASRYFDLAEVYVLMRKLENNEKPLISHVHINSKKFIRTLYIESRK